MTRNGRSKVKAGFHLRTTLAASLAMAAMGIGPASADSNGFVVVNVVTPPYAQIELITVGPGNPTSLQLVVPPPPDGNQTSPGVHFRVTGNAGASVQATPDAFLTAPTELYAAEHLGSALHNGTGPGAIGYRIALKFPSVAAAPCPTIQTAYLPGTVDGPTAPLTASFGANGFCDGRVNIESNIGYVPGGGIAQAGNYTGAITLTVAAY